MTSATYEMDWDLIDDCLDSAEHGESILTRVNDDGDKFPIPAEHYRSTRPIEVQAKFQQMPAGAFAEMISRDALANGVEFGLGGGVPDLLDIERCNEWILTYCRTTYTVARVSAGIVYYV